MAIDNVIRAELEGWSFEGETDFEEFLQKVKKRLMDYAVVRIFIKKLPSSNEERFDKVWKRIYGLKWIAFKQITQDIFDGLRLNPKGGMAPNIIHKEKNKVKYHPKEMLFISEYSIKRRFINKKLFSITYKEICFQHPAPQYKIQINPAHSVITIKVFDKEKEQIIKEIIRKKEHDLRLISKHIDGL